MIIPGFFIAALTFPGVMVHEAAHRFFCDLAHVPVYKVSYFRLGNPSGYVIHGKVNGLKSAFLIAIGPLIVNTLVCMLLTWPIIFPLFILGDASVSTMYLVLMWVGFSVGMHAFPSNQDMDNFVNVVKAGKKVGLLYLVAIPFALIVKLANVLKFLWFDLIYAVAISFVIPLMLLG